MENFSEKQLIYGEWLITNGIGGYASGTLSGALTRRYHSLLNAALPNPYGRTVMLSYVADSLILEDKTEILLSVLFDKGHSVKEKTHLVEYRLEYGIPIFKYQYGDVIIEKSLLLVHQQNTLHMTYRLLSQHKVELKWRPFFHFRSYGDPVNREIPDESYSVHAKESRFEIECPHFPPLRVHTNASFTLSSETLPDVYYAIEAARGYESSGPLKSPGIFHIPLVPKEHMSFIVSTEEWDTLLALNTKNALASEKVRKKNLLKMSGPAGKFPTTSKLVLAADQFIIKPRARANDTIRLQAIGQESRTVIAGYPWFTDWGRDTMISLEGLTLLTGRNKDAYSILLTFAQYVQNGLIPNMFPDGENQGIYNTADASLWFFHAIERYIEYTGDMDILELLLPKLNEIIQQHVHGTRFGIKMDTDGLLCQGETGLQLTWMDAKVGDWVVTPRRGKAVEINALWYNALRLYEKWADKSLELSQQCFQSFNKRFWFEEGKYLYDVVDGENGDDASLRPNQLFAISLRYPILQKGRWKSVLEVVEKELYTPVGLRTLSPKHPDYKATYDGDLRARDAAYHQGTVWPWLIGPFIDVWFKVYPEDYEKAERLLSGLVEHLNNNTLWSIGEIFDACTPYRERGCFAQAWSVAELLRALIKTLPFLQKH